MTPHACIITGPRGSSVTLHPDEAAAWRQAVSYVESYWSVDGPGSSGAGDVPLGNRCVQMYADFTGETILVLPVDVDERTVLLEGLPEEIASTLIAEGIHPAPLTDPDGTLKGGVMPTLIEGGKILSIGLTDHPLPGQHIRLIDVDAPKDVVLEVSDEDRAHFIEKIAEAFEVPVELLALDGNDSDRVVAAARAAAPPTPDQMAAWAAEPSDPQAVRNLLVDENDPEERERRFREGRTCLTPCSEGHVYGFGCIGGAYPVDADGALMLGVWLVTTGQWSAYGVDSSWPTEALALDRVAELGRGRVDEPKLKWTPFGPPVGEEVGADRWTCDILLDTGEVEWNGVSAKPYNFGAMIRESERGRVLVSRTPFVSYRGGPHRVLRLEVVGEHEGCLKALSEQLAMAKAAADAGLLGIWWAANDTDGRLGKTPGLT